jgi:D-arabinose 1-dehydrogenase-like Zn-dependent alcohol dehydrogenase
MRVAIIPAPGAPVDIRQMPDPKPGPGQVRVRIHACGICGTDCHVWHGHFPIQHPCSFGHEPVGIIDDIGAGVTDWRSGDRVGVAWTQAGCGTCAVCKAGKPSHCEHQKTWVTNGGGQAEYMIAEATGCVRLPDGLPFEHAAPLMCAGFTAMSAYRRSDPRPKDRVAVLGLGGLGHLAVQIAKAKGHEVIVVTSSEAKRADARQLGADEVIVVREHAGRELAAIGGADVVLATSNHMGQTSQILHGLRSEGRLVTVAVSGDAITVDPILFLEKELRLVGAHTSHRDDLVDVINMAAAGIIQPWLVTTAAEEKGITMALDALGRGGVRYRQVVQWTSI